MRCLETRKFEGYTRRRYERPDGSRVTSYEIFEHSVFRTDLKRLIQRASAFKAKQIRFERQPADPDRIDAVLQALEQNERQRDIAKRLKISTQTIQRIKKGY